VRTIWSGRHNSIVTCSIIPKQNDSSIMTSRRWRHVILVCWCCLAEEVRIPKQDGGRGRTTIAYIPEKQEPELMYKLFSAVCCSINELIDVLK